MIDKVDKKNVLEAARKLDGLFVDFNVGTRSLDIFEGLKEKLIPVNYEGLRRMSHFHLILTLCKYCEFYRHFHQIIPKDCKQECKNLFNVIESKPIQEFRDKFVGHLIDDNTGLPLSNDKLIKYLNQIYGEDEAQYISWINDKKNIYPNTVVSIAEKVRDLIMSENGISKEEMNQWVSTKE